MKVIELVAVALVQDVSTRMSPPFAVHSKARRDRSDRNRAGAKEKAALRFRLSVMPNDPISGRGAGLSQPDSAGGSA